MLHLGVKGDDDDDDDDDEGPPNQALAILLVYLWGQVFRVTIVHRMSHARSTRAGVSVAQ